MRREQDSDGWKTANEKLVEGRGVTDVTTVELARTN